MKIALVGNQNCGKTTLFNQLTGSNQHVGNFPGVTVEKKEGIIRKFTDMRVIDLPGVYSLSPYTPEEKVTRDFLLFENPNCVLNIVDATNLERNLYLTLQILSLSIPCVIALNMMDEINANKIKLDIEGLKKEFGVQIVPISASKGEGIDELCKVLHEVSTKQICPKLKFFFNSELQKALDDIENKIEKSSISKHFLAQKILEGDSDIIDHLKFNDALIATINSIKLNLQNLKKVDIPAIIADERYNYIESICQKVLVKPHFQTKEQHKTLQIDSILTNKFLAIPVFLLIMFSVFYLTFGSIGAFLSKTFMLLIDYFTVLVDGLLTSLDISRTVHSLVIDGIFTGVGSVLSFLPTIVVLFFFLSLLEDSGYMARVAFVMDKILRKIGLSGRSFVPLLIGFGCSCPAIMSTRTLASEKDRKMTIFLIPFISCSAKLPIYALFTQAFFTEYKAIVMIILYIFGILVGIISALIMTKTVFKGEPCAFVMELPSYRMPSLKTVFMHMIEKAKEFAKKAFTIIFLASIVIWFLQNFNYKFAMVENASESMLMAIGRFIAPIFSPLGFGTPEAATALIAGLSAKEAVVSTLTVMQCSLSGSAINILQNIFTPLSAFSFLIFVVLYTPCFAAIATAKKELGMKFGATKMIVFQNIVAWICSFLVFNIGKLFF